MKINEIVNEDISRRGFLKGAGAVAAGAAGINTKAETLNLRTQAFIETGITQIFWCRVIGEDKIAETTKTEISKWASTPARKRWIQKTWQDQSSTLEQYLEKAKHENRYDEYLSNIRKSCIKDSRRVISDLKTINEFNEGQIEEAATEDSIKKVNSLFSR